MLLTLNLTRTEVKIYNIQHSSGTPSLRDNTLVIIHKIDENFNCITPKAMQAKWHSGRAHESKGSHKYKDCEAIDNNGNNSDDNDNNDENKNDNKNKNKNDNNNNDNKYEK